MTGEALFCGQKPLHFCHFWDTAVSGHRPAHLCHSNRPTTKACGTKSASDWLENMGESQHWQPASSHHLADRQPGPLQVQASQPTPLSYWQDASSHHWRGRLTTFVVGQPLHSSATGRMPAATPLTSNWQDASSLHGRGRLATFVAGQLLHSSSTGRVPVTRTRKAGYPPCGRLANLFLITPTTLSQI